MNFNNLARKPDMGQEGWAIDNKYEIGYISAFLKFS
jgi:hypothetical protein